MISFKQYLTELGDTETGRKTLNRYITKAKKQIPFFKSFGTTYIRRASERNAAEPVSVNVKKWEYFTRKAENRNRGINLAKNILNK